MCAILGANDFSLFEILIGVNQERGTSSTGLTFLGDEFEPAVYKLEGKFRDDIFKDDFDKNKSYFIAHLRAPTSHVNNSSWTESTAHPFMTDDWIVNHNGVLTNTEELIEQYELKDNVCSVDSSVVPALLQMYSEFSTLTDVECIERTLQLLEGTFSLCIINRKTSNVYIARQGSTLFYNKDSSGFSSIQGQNYEELAEGEIMQLILSDGDKWKSVGNFTSKSPFLF